MLQEGSFSESTPDVVANRFWVVRLCVQTSPNSNYLNPEPSSRIQEKCTTVTWGARSIALAITQERNLQRKVDPGPSTPVFVLSILCPSRSLSLCLSLSLSLSLPLAPSNIGLWLLVTKPQTPIVPNVGSQPGPVDILRWYRLTTRLGLGVYRVKISYLRQKPDTRTIFFSGSLRFRDSLCHSLWIRFLIHSWIGITTFSQPCGSGRGCII